MANMDRQGDFSAKKGNSPAYTLSLRILFLYELERIMVQTSSCYHMMGTHQGPLVFLPVLSNTTSCLVNKDRNLETFKWQKCGVPGFFFIYILSPWHIYKVLWEVNNVQHTLLSVSAFHIWPSYLWNIWKIKSYLLWVFQCSFLKPATNEPRPIKIQ